MRLNCTATMANGPNSNNFCSCAWRKNERICYCYSSVRAVIHCYPRGGHVSRNCWCCLVLVMGLDRVFTFFLRCFRLPCVLDWSTSCRRPLGCQRRISTRKHRPVSSRWATSRTSTTLPRRTAFRLRRSSRLQTCSKVARDRCSTSSTASTISASSYVYALSIWYTWWPKK